MIRKIRMFLILLLLVFSFVYTEKIARLMREKSRLYRFIDQVKDDYYIGSVDAVIENTTIIPGVYGRKVNVLKSYNNMKNKGYFDDKFLIYDLIKPKISFSDNLDKTIIKGNSSGNKLTLLKDNKNYKNICIVNKNYKCVQNDIKILPTIILNHSNYYHEIKKISSGDIIFLEESINDSDLKIIKREIEYRNYQIVDIYEMIDEKN